MTGDIHETHIAACAFNFMNDTGSPGQIDNKWTEEIEKDFSKWLNDHIDDLPVPKEQIRELLKKRMW